jgi:hypothetical protein
MLDNCKDWSQTPFIKNKKADLVGLLFYDLSIHLFAFYDYGDGTVVGKFNLHHRPKLSGLD